jgi:hypothetical protein
MNKSLPFILTLLNPYTMYDPNKHLRLLFIEKSTPFTFELYTLHDNSIIQRKFIQIKSMGI